jgi:hypothetical protein
VTQDPGGLILRLATLVGAAFMKTNDTTFADGAPSEQGQWDSGVRHLVSCGLVDAHADKAQNPARFTLMRSCAAYVRIIVASALSTRLTRTWTFRRRLSPTSSSEAREVVVGLPHRGLFNFDRPHGTRLFIFDHRVGAAAGARIRRPLGA